MLINGKQYRSIWLDREDPSLVQTFDQRLLPFEVKIVDLRTADDAYEAIKSMLVRGAPLIGATGAFGLYIAALECPEIDFIETLKSRADYLKSARPTAVNLAFAIDKLLDKLSSTDTKTSAIPKLKEAALQLLEDEVEMSKAIGLHGLELIKEISKRKNGEPVNILTHCNAGWIACIDYGTATAPMYMAKEAEIPIHVWVDETRPRNQGARLTAWELEQNDIPHTLVVDNAGGHLMQHGMVDIVFVGSDRTTRSGDVANKIGTYLKALAAHDNNVPFYVALPSSTIDWTISDGVKEIPIEERSQDEVLVMEGTNKDQFTSVEITNGKSKASNFGFDVTPAKYVSGLITERGISEASEEGLLKHFPEQKSNK